MKYLLSLFILLTVFNAFGTSPTMRKEQTLYNGKVLYGKYWNFWSRIDGIVKDSGPFFLNYEHPNYNVSKLIKDIGVSSSFARTERDIWNKVNKVWNFLSRKTINSNSEYATLTNQNRWPTIIEHANYYKNNGQLVWAACFSKAHLFALILGRVGIPRYRLAIASAHHTVNGAPATASHVFIALYIKNRWIYLDPTATSNRPYLSSFEKGYSVGISNFVDYKHPFKIIPLPTSNLKRVPLLLER